MAAKDEAGLSVRDRRALFEANNGEPIATISADVESSVAQTKRLFERSKNAAQTSRYKPPLLPKPKDLSLRKSTLIPPPVPRHAPPAIPSRPESLRRKSWSNNNNSCAINNVHLNVNTNRLRHRSSVDELDNARESVISDEGPPQTTGDPVDYSSADESVSGDGDDDDASDRGEESYGLPLQQLKDFDEEGIGNFAKQDTLHTSVINQMKRDGLFAGLAECRKQQTQIKMEFASSRGSSMDDTSTVSTEENNKFGSNGDETAADNDEAVVTLRTPPQVPPHRFSVTTTEKYASEGSSEEKRLIHLEKLVLEICMKEEHFVNVLTLMIKDYPRYLATCEIKANKFLSTSNYQEVVNKIVSELSPILTVHENLLVKLDGLAIYWDSRKPELANLMIRNIDFLKICMNYLVLKQKLCDEFKKVYDSNSSFEYATRRFEDSVMNCNSLHDSRFSTYKYAPVLHMVNGTSGVTFLQQMDMVHQNVVRYKLFMDEYKKLLPEGHVELNATENVLMKLDDIVRTIENKLDERESLSFLIELQQRFQERFNVLVPGRKLIRHEILLRQTRRDRSERQLILFTDSLLLCKVNLRYFRRLPIDKLVVTVEDSVERECWFNIYSQLKSTAILCPNKETRDYWVQDINAAKKAFLLAMKHRNLSIHSNNEETKGTTFQALWIADEDATMCMMQDCAKKFNVLTRRHHCRICGYVICHACSGYAPVKSDNYESLRVCPECYYEMQELFVTGELFPKYMLVWSSPTVPHTFSMNSTDLRILYKCGKSYNIKDLFTAPKHGRRKRSENLDKSDKFVAFGTVWMKNVQRYARLCRDYKLYVYAARYDPSYIEQLSVLGFSWAATKSSKDDKTHFRLTPEKGSIRSHIDFNVFGKTSELWQTALENLLQSPNTNTADDSD